MHRFERDHHGRWFYHDHQGQGGNGHHQGPPHADEQGSEHGHDQAPISEEEHHVDERAAASIATAFAALGRAKTERQLEAVQNLTEYGVTKPDTLINVYGEDSLQPPARYAIGDVAPDTVSRYVMLVGSSVLVTIPNYQIENLLDLIDAVAPVSN